jgi:hypothetical protein
MAVGTHILHFNGTSWKSATTSAEPGQTSGLAGVAATSGSNAWAVGNYNDTGTLHDVILHWTGKSWVRMIA